MKYFSLVVTVLLCLVYLSAWIPPTATFNLWLLTFLIPFALVANLLLLIIFVVRRQRGSWYLLIALLLSIPYLVATIGVKAWFTKRRSTVPNTFTVLNYNVGGFEMRHYRWRDRDSARHALRSWILESDADIKCIQEFPSFSWSRSFKILPLMDSLGLNYYYSQSTTDPLQYQPAGVLIVSRFPIVSHGDVMASENGFNRIAYADVKIGEDTVRILSVHLQSMGLSALDHNPSSLNAVESTTRTILQKLKAGVFQRSQQVRSLSSFIDASPYPAICAGDFNDLPYSYSYRHLRWHLKNAFEESGRGLGFTYNGGTVKLLRIDNQFYTRGIHNLSFETMYSVVLSDHFPVRGSYVIDADR